MTILVVLIMFGLYGIFHSILANKGTKMAVQQRFGERIYYGFYRAFYNIVAVVTLLPIYSVLSSNPGGTVYALDAAWRPVIELIGYVGLIGAAISLIQIDVFRFIGLRQILAYFRGTPLPLPDEGLKTGGLYQVVRHPLYLFSLMIVWSSMSMNAATFGMNLGITLYFVFGSLYEEQRMVKGFGQAYIDYQARVPWLIPGLHLQPRLPFGNKY